MVRSYLLFCKKKCRIYAACGVSQTPIFNNLSEDTVVLNKTAAFLFDHCNFTTKDKLIDDFISILVNVRDYSLIKKECTECIDKMIDIGLIVETADDRE